MQTDPDRYEDQFNLYAYVKSHPVNDVGPSGTQTWPQNLWESVKENSTILV